MCSVVLPSFELFQKAKQAKVGRKHLLSLLYFKLCLLPRPWPRMTETQARPARETCTKETPKTLGAGC